MKFRQVHLDFHTSEQISQVGCEFDKRQFQQMLQRGHVDSITLFSKCHHGWSYHPTKANRMHPGLSFDLLGAQIEAAHEIGVKTPVYLSAGLDEKTAREHPEWLFRHRDQSTSWAKDFAQAGYHMLCFHSPYLDELLAQVREVCENYEADGIFMDITAPRVCYCHNCVRTMRERGLNPFDEKNARAFGEEVYANYTRAVREAVDSVKPGLPVFHNAGATPRGRRDLEYMSTHTEIETLPTGGWGYDNFPMIARYVQPHGREYLGMTGKFHLTWGEFGGYKHPNALRYETALAVANGAKCSIGDQLHPRGKADPETYRIIGEAYAEIERREPWLDGVRSVADIGLLSYDAWLLKHPELRAADADASLSDVGALRILQEGHYLFDILDCESDFSPYRLLILPDRIRIGKALREKLDAFVASGGRLLASGKSGLFEDGDAFAYDFGVRHSGEQTISPIYLSPCLPMEGCSRYDGVVYAAAEKALLTDGEMLADLKLPYFERTVEHFCSHGHAPAEPSCKGVGAVLGRNGAYVAAPLFREYARFGSRTTKLMLLTMLEHCLGKEKTLSVELPVGASVTLMDQTEKSRMVLHLLWAPRTVKGDKKIEIIEDVVPLYHVPVSVRVREVQIERVSLAPTGEELAFTVAEDGAICFEVPSVELHAMIVLDYRTIGG